MNTKILGNAGEDAAAKYLTDKGYIICTRNYRVPVGEIDLIARKDGVIVFIEVKTRRSYRCGEAALAVNRHKQQKIIKTALWYIRQNNLDDCPCRFDVVEVYSQVSGEFLINHFEEAFEVS